MKSLKDQVSESFVNEGDTWTKERFKEEVDTLHKDMKQHGWNKAEAKKSVISMMKDNNIVLEDFDGV